MDPLAPIYPEGALDTRVIPSVPVPRVPDTPPRCLNEGIPRDFYKRRMIRETAGNGMADRLAIIDKAFPHSRYDAMILASNDDVRSDVTRFAPSTLRSILRLAYSFVEYANEPRTVDRFGLNGGYVHVCFNYDIDTVDRDNGMGYEKRFHLHLNCWPERDLAGIRTIRFGELPPTDWRWQVIDPAAHLMQRVAYDALGDSIFDFPVMPPDPVRDARQRLPVGLKVALPGWHALLDERCAAVLHRLHSTLRSAYEAVYLAFTGRIYRRPDPWSRPPLLSLDAITANVRAMSWLSDESKEWLIRLGSTLRPLRPSDVDRFRADSDARTRLTLGGLDYSVGLSSGPIAHPSEEAYSGVIMTVPIRLFGSVGAAGSPPIARSSVARLDRQTGPEMTDEEIRDRAEFRDIWMEQSLSKVSDVLEFLPVPAVA